MEVSKSQINCEQDRSTFRKDLTTGLLAAAFFSPFSDYSTPSLLASEPTPQCSNPVSLETEQLIDRAARYFLEARTRNGLILDRSSNRTDYEITEADREGVASLAASGYGLAALPVLVERGTLTKTKARELLRETLRTVEELSKDTPGHWLHHFVDGVSGAPALNSEVSTVDTVLFYYGAIAAGEYLGGAEREQVYRMLSKVDFDLLRTNAGTHPGSLNFGHGYHYEPETETVRFLVSRWDRVSEGIIVPFLAIGTGKAPVACWTEGLDRTETWIGSEHKTFDNLPLFTFFYPLGYLPIKDSIDSTGTNYWQEAADAVDLQQEFSGQVNLPTEVFGYSASDGPQGYYAFEAEDHGKGVVIAPPAAIAALPFATEDTHSVIPYLHSRDLLSGKYGIAAAYEPASGWKAEDMLGIDIGSMLLMLDAHGEQIIWQQMEKSPVIKKALVECGFETD